MDKNTIYGLILMALVFFGFMWLSPKNEKKTQETPTTEQTETPTGGTPIADALSGQDSQWLAQNIMANGESVTLPDGQKGFQLKDSTLDLTLVGDSISGTVKSGGKSYTWAQIISGDNTVMDVKERNDAIQAVRDASGRIGKYGRFARFLQGDNRTLNLENDVLKLEFSSKSGSITRAELKDYTTEYSADETKKVKNPVVVFNDSTNVFNFDLPTAQPLQTSELYFTPQAVNDTTVRMVLELEGGSYWGVEYVLPAGKDYVVKAKVIQKGMSPLQSNNHTLGFDWSQEMKRQEQGRMFEERQSGLYYKYAGGSVENLSESKNDKEERKAGICWIAFKNQFFSTVVVPSRPFYSADFESDVLKNSDYLKKMDTRAQIDKYDWEASNPVSFSIFIGPNLYPLLSGLDDHINAGEDLKLTKLIPLGWSLFRWINTCIVIPVFNLLGSTGMNYGIVILLLTIFIKVILFPLTYKSYKSQAVMRILQPEIKAINEKYPGNENALQRQQKTMALYRKAGASPMSGCLPMLLQMPILFAMFSFFPSCIELRGQSFLWAHDLSAPDAIISWSGNIPFVTSYFGNHVSLFCLLMTVTNIIYTYINTQNNPGTMPGMKWMMYLMPIFFLVFFNNYAAGLSYYYFLSLLITIIQTYCFRYIIKEEDVRKKMAENAKKPQKKSGFAARLEEMQRRQQEMLKEQQKQRRR